MPTAIIKRLGIGKIKTFVRKQKYWKNWTKYKV
jgi:hypothetical protein